MISLLAIDPVLKGDLLWAPLLIVVLKVLAVFVTGLVATMLMVWFERKVVAGMGNRIGPNKAGPFGLLQTLADGIKLFFKEDLVPDRAVSLLCASVPFIFNHSAWRRFPRRQRWISYLVWSHHARAACRSVNWCVVHTGHFGNRGIRNHARWLVQRLEVSIARLGSRICTNGQL